MVAIVASAISIADFICEEVSTVARNPPSGGLPRSILWVAEVGVGVARKDPPAALGISDYKVLKEPEALIRRRAFPLMTFLARVCHVLQVRVRGVEANRGALGNLPVDAGSRCHRPANRLLMPGADMASLGGTSDPGRRRTTTGPNGILSLYTPTRRGWMAGEFPWRR